MITPITIYNSSSNNSSNNGHNQLLLQIGNIGMPQFNSAHGISHILLTFI
jgi:hypothetical protein